MSFVFDHRSTLSVGMPIDLICYERDSPEVQWRPRFDEATDRTCRDVTSEDMA